MFPINNLQQQYFVFFLFINNFMVKLNKMVYFKYIDLLYA